MYIFLKEKKEEDELAGKGPEGGPTGMCQKHLQVGILKLGTNHGLPGAQSRAGPGESG